ncbi:class GN sortase [Candidatus Thiodiazotropha sp. CDECU1]|uniref:class GN sortase n=1 Tax=Candidatus Thiodiazotropha sp. CDECU1 TaxID=3065865 RepID=UPI00292DDFCE|nr:class GN sortase [Candidatus Thiodiazotropha sp. CDECU1]
MKTLFSNILRSCHISPLLFLVACCFLVQGAWIEAKAWLAQALIATAWNVTASQADNIQPWPWADTWPVARLEVPRLGVRRYILAGVSGRTLAFGPGWAMQTALPGTEGASLIAGHRDTHFRFLKGLRQGDRLLLDTPEKSRVMYRVTATAVVDQRQSRLISDQGERELILVTCYPFEALRPGGELRYVVWAEAESRQTFGLESTLNQTIITNLNEADPNISPSRLSASRLSG